MKISYIYNVLSPRTYSWTKKMQRAFPLAMEMDFNHSKNQGVLKMKLMYGRYECNIWFDTQFCIIPLKDVIAPAVPAIF